jgi:hypothetical protein
VLGRPGGRRRYAAALARADAVLCVGSSLRSYLAAEFPAYAGKLHVVPNPLDFDRFPMRDGPPGDLRRWLYVGRLVEHKGVRLLLEAFGIVAAADPAPTLTLVGSGPLAEDLRARAAGLGLGERVRVLPALPPDRVAALLCDPDLLVHLSTRETFGLTVVEAIATGTPVLVARSEGTQETMAGLHGRAGLLLEPGADASAVATAYRDLRRRLPELDLPGAREELRARYGRDAVAAQLRHFYTGVLEPAEAPVRVPDEYAERVIVVADGGSDLDQARPAVERALAAGVRVDLLTTVDGSGWPGPGAAVHRLRVGGISAAAELAVRRVPGKGLAMLLAAARHRPGPALETAVRRAQRAHRHAAGRILRGSWWTAARTRAVWSAVRRQALPHLALDRTRVVVAPGPVGRGVAGRLVTGHPGIPVTRTLDEVPGAAPAASAQASRR